MDIIKLENQLGKRWALIATRAYLKIEEPGAYKGRVFWWNKKIVDDLFADTKRYEEESPESPTKLGIIWNRGLCAWELGWFGIAQNDFRKLSLVNCSMQKMAEKSLKRVIAGKWSV